MNTSQRPASILFEALAQAARYALGNVAAPVAAKRLYGYQILSLQRLAATLRHGDLLEELARGDQAK